MSGQPAPELERARAALRALYFYHAGRASEALQALGIDRPASLLGDDKIYEIVMTEVKRVAGPTQRDGAYDMIDSWSNHPKAVQACCPGCTRTWVRWRGEKPAPCPACDHPLQVPGPLAQAEGS